MFAIHSWVGQPEVRGVAIEVSAGDIDRLSALWTRQTGHPPSLEKLRELIDAEVREEVFYREAVRLGLDRHDVIVRRRLVQKLEFMTRDLANFSRPSDQELRGFLEENRERYRRPERLSFGQLFFDLERRSGAETEMKALLAKLRSEKPAFDTVISRGDPSLLPATWLGQTLEEVSKHFGTEFAATLFAKPEEGWLGPIRSPFGAHLVRIESHRPAQDATLEEARSDLERDWRLRRRQEGDAAVYERLLARYDVTVAEVDLVIAAADLRSHS